MSLQLLQMSFFIIPSVSFSLSPHVFLVKSSKSVLHNLMFYFPSSQNATCVISHYVFVDLYWCVVSGLFPNSLEVKSPGAHDLKSRRSTFQEANESADSDSKTRPASSVITTDENNAALCGEGFFFRCEL